MYKPTYYLWNNDFPTEAALENEKEKLNRLGFRVVTFYDGQKDKNIHEGIKAMIKNHFDD